MEEYRVSAEKHEPKVDGRRLNTRSCRIFSPVNLDAEKRLATTNKPVTTSSVTQVSSDSSDPTPA